MKDDVEDCIGLYSFFFIDMKRLWKSGLHASGAIWLLVHSVKRVLEHEVCYE